MSNIIKPGITQHTSGSIPNIQGSSMIVSAVQNGSDAISIYAPEVFFTGGTGLSQDVWRMGIEGGSSPENAFTGNFLHSSLVVYWNLDSSGSSLDLPSPRSLRYLGMQRVNNSSVALYKPKQQGSIFVWDENSRVVVGAQQVSGTLNVPQANQSLQRAVFKTGRYDLVRSADALSLALSANDSSKILFENNFGNAVIAMSTALLVGDRSVNGWVSISLPSSELLTALQANNGGTVCCDFSSDSITNNYLPPTGSNNSVAIVRGALSHSGNTINTRVGVYRHNGSTGTSAWRLIGTDIVDTLPGGSANNRSLSNLTSSPEECAALVVVPPITFNSPYKYTSVNSPPTNGSIIPHNTTHVLQDLQGTTSAIFLPNKLLTGDLSDNDFVRILITDAKHTGHLHFASDDLVVVGSEKTNDQARAICANYKFNKLIVYFNQVGTVTTMFKNSDGVVEQVFAGSLTVVSHIQAANTTQSNWNTPVTPPGPVLAGVTGSYYITAIQRTSDVPQSNTIPRTQIMVFASGNITKVWINSSYLTNDSSDRGTLELRIAGSVHRGGWGLANKICVITDSLSESAAISKISSSDNDTVGLYIGGTGASAIKSIYKDGSGSTTALTATRTDAFNVYATILPAFSTIPACPESSGGTVNHTRPYTFDLTRRSSVANAVIPDGTVYMVQSGSIIDLYVTKDLTDGIASGEVIKVSIDTTQANGDSLATVLGTANDICVVPDIYTSVQLKAYASGLPGGSVVLGMLDFTNDIEVYHNDMDGGISTFKGSNITVSFPSNVTTGNDYNWNSIPNTCDDNLLPSLNTARLPLVKGLPPASPASGTIYMDVSESHNKYFYVPSVLVSHNTTDRRMIKYRFAAPTLDPNQYSDEGICVVSGADITGPGDYDSVVTALEDNIRVLVSDGFGDLKLLKIDSQTHFGYDTNESNEKTYVTGKQYPLNTNWGSFPTTCILPAGNEVITITHSSPYNFEVIQGTPPNGTIIPFGKCYVKASSQNNSVRLWFPQTLHNRDGNDDTTFMGNITQANEFVDHMAQVSSICVFTNEVSRADVMSIVERSALGSVIYHFNESYNNPEILWRKSLNVVNEIGTHPNNEAVGIFAEKGDWDTILGGCPLDGPVPSIVTHLRPYTFDLTLKSSVANAVIPDGTVYMVQSGSIIDLYVTKDLSDEPVTGEVIKVSIDTTQANGDSLATVLGTSNKICVVPAIHTSVQLKAYASTLPGGSVVLGMVDFTKEMEVYHNDMDGGISTFKGPKITVSFPASITTGINYNWINIPDRCKDNLLPSLNTARLPLVKSVPPASPDSGTIYMETDDSHHKYFYVPSVLVSHNTTDRRMIKYRFAAPTLDPDEYSDSGICVISGSDITGPGDYDSVVTALEDNIRVLVSDGFGDLKLLKVNSQAHFGYDTNESNEKTYVTGKQYPLNTNWGSFPSSCILPTGNEVIPITHSSPYNFGIIQGTPPNGTIIPFGKCYVKASSQNNSVRLWFPQTLYNRDGNDDTTFMGNITQAGDFVDHMSQATSICVFTNEVSRTDVMAIVEESAIGSVIYHFNESHNNPEILWRKSVGGVNEIGTHPNNEAVGIFAEKGDWDTILGGCPLDGPVPTVVTHFSPYSVSVTRDTPIAGSTLRSDQGHIWVDNQSNEPWVLVNETFALTTETGDALQIRMKNLTDSADAALRSLSSICIFSADTTIADMTSAVDGAGDGAFAIHIGAENNGVSTITHSYNNSGTVESGSGHIGHTSETVDYITDVNFSTLPHNCPTAGGTVVESGGCCRTIEVLANSESFLPFVSVVTGLMKLGEYTTVAYQHLTIANIGTEPANFTVYLTAKSVPDDADVYMPFQSIGPNVTIERPSIRLLKGQRLFIEADTDRLAVRVSSFEEQGDVVIDAS